MKSFLLTAGLAMMAVPHVAQADTASAVEFGKRLAGAFCAEAQEIYVQRIVVRPMGGFCSSGSCPVGTLESQEDVFACKQAVGRAVSRDAQCQRLYSGTMHDMPPAVHNMIRLAFNEFQGLCRL